MTRHAAMTAIAAVVSIAVGLRVASDAGARPVTVSDLLAATSAGPGSTIPVSGGCSAWLIMSNAGTRWCPTCERFS